VDHSGDAAKGINCVPQLDTGVLGLIPPRGVDVCHTSVFVLSCVRKGRCASQPPVSPQSQYSGSTFINEVHKPVKREAFCRTGLLRVVVACRVITVVAGALSHRKPSSIFILLFQLN
jgi:hypothetical protein